MVNTKKLYYKNTYASSFSAVVTGCLSVMGGYDITLDATLFYPEGGGQPADIGRLGDATVLDVHERDGLVLHRTDKPLMEGDSVRGEIDWERRFSLMQQHTGEHIVSGIILSLFKLDNVGFHMGKDYVTVDLNGELSEDELSRVERLANQAVYKNVEVITDEEGRITGYRSKKKLTGPVRIVSIPGYDACACCGLHCAFTGEVGVIKLLTAQKYKSGMRLYLLCGEKAQQDYTVKNKSVYAIASRLSVKTNQVLEAVTQLQDDNAVLKQKLVSCQTDLFRRKAASLSADAKQICLFEENCSSHDLSRFCMILCEQVDLAAVFSKVDGAGYKYAIGSQIVDVRSIGNKLNTALNGRGGGQKALVQGTVYASEESIKSFFADFK